MPARKVDNIIVSQSWDKIEDWKFEERCGMITADTFFSDQKYLFLHNIYSNDQPARRQSYGRNNDTGPRNTYPSDSSTSTNDSSTNDSSTNDSSTNDSCPSKSCTYGSG
ncbi:uncharacterized protein N7518_002760 [Penicillium psychrosexuale]|uniref:uncharacterized protein n=1 Tax=Penicillium psychrosexuale TaxID=1002107 RepID=UPI0025456CF7|nr:uncharacterized protein N7518_002760 [Penicillium psychrosexuale]KAJ5800692.1 hypothetical protein N7518_002760 [Penicillium psychrosexuale]